MNSNFSASSLVFAAVMLSGVALPGTPPQPPAYGTARTVTVGAPERWDYLTLDRESHRLYLAHGDRVDILDGQTGSLLGRVSGIPGGTHGIGIVSPLRKGYTDDGEAGEG